MKFFSFYPRNYSKKQDVGFTLIELMVVISILAIVSAVGLVGFSQAQKVARDSRRKADLHSISLALELFYQANHHYPCDGTGGCGGSNTFLSSSATDPWIPGLDQNYIGGLPRDPLKNQAVKSITGATGYQYEAYSSCKHGGPFSDTVADNLHWYKLEAGLENAKDPDINWNIPSQECNAADTTGCGTNQQLYCVYSYGTFRN